MRACTSSNSRVFSMAMTAWSAKVRDEIVCLWRKWVGREVASETWAPIGLPSRMSGTPSAVRKPPSLGYHVERERRFGISQHVMDMKLMPF